MAYRLLFLAGLALLTALAFTPLQAQGDTAWGYVSPDSVRWVTFDPVGHPLVITPSGVTALHPDSGTPLWKFPATPVDYLRAGPDGLLLIGSNTTLAGVDPTNGAAVWARADLPASKDRELYPAFADSVIILRTRTNIAALHPLTGKTRWDSTSLPAGLAVRAAYAIPRQNLLLMIARTGESDVALLGVTLDSGIVRWRQNAFFNTKPKFKRTDGVEHVAGEQFPIILSDSALFTYFSSEGPICLDQRTGAVRWRALHMDGAPVPDRAQGQPRPLLADDLIIVSGGRNLTALDAGTGRLRWKAARPLPDTATLLGKAGEAVVVGGFGREHSYLVSFGQDGVPRRPGVFSLPASARGWLIGESTFVAAKNSLYAVPAATGVEQRIADIPFKGQEVPWGIENLAGGERLLLGSYNIARLDRDGSIVFAHFYPPPGPSLGETLGAVYSASVGYYPPQRPPLIATMGRYPGNMARLNWYSRARHFHYFYTGSPDANGRKGFSLVLVDKRDGRELGRLWFKERRPDMDLDWITATAYVRRGPDTVLARRLPLGPPEPGELPAAWPLVPEGEDSTGAD